MKKIFVFLAITLSVISQAQDTTWVQTFTYDSISTRRGIFNFPAELEGKQFEKVLMYYNIKCDPLTPWDSYNCGEWDYLTYTWIYDHTGNFDSLKKEHPHYLLNGAWFSSFNYLNTPYYNFFQHYEYFPNYSIDVDVDHIIGSGTLPLETPFQTTTNTQQVQILYTAADLLAAGVIAGDIAKLKFDFTALGANLNNLTIKMKHFSGTEINELENGGFTEVFKGDKTFSSTGWQTLNLVEPFVYDGTSGILVEVTWENLLTAAISYEVNASTTPTNTVLTASKKLGVLNVAATNHVLLDLDNHDFGNAISICFWARGDEAYLPANTSIVEGTDSLNNRLVNIHFPWSNSRHYWDCGEGSGYDRIDLDATSDEIEGEWHHWAFTKNASTGEMKIYKDGTLWHSGTGKNRPIGIINKFQLGKSVNNNYNWAGLMDEFSIWDKELDESTIAAYMHSTIDGSHPDYSNLVAYYDFDKENFVEDKSGNDVHGMMTTPEMIDFNAYSQAGYTVSNVRPNINFVQGTHVFTIDSVLTTDTIQVAALDLASFAINGRKYIVDDIAQVYPEGFSYTYNYLGEKIDSTFHLSTDHVVNDSLFYYEEPFEIIERYEIGRFITPYGIGFDLGPNGFTYLYDVTDYQSLLSGAVDFAAHNTQELIDVKFAFIEGIPPRDVIKVEKLWDGNSSYTYANLDNDVNLSSTTVNLDAEGDMFKVRSRITGHGHFGSVNCCEWGPGEGRDHYLLVDGVERYAWEIWQETECGDNPNTGQGGTWPYAREGWCPGDVVEEHDFEITEYVTPGASVTLDYDIEDVPAGDPDQGNGNYVISMHMITYGEPNFMTDATIEDVLNPNDWEYYGKWNPTCQYPRVILKNTGANNLTSAKISVWVGEFGENVVTYEWTGNLAFLESETIEIPVPDDWWYDWEGKMTFSAEVYEANGMEDEYAQNNIYTTTFEAAPHINDPFYIWFKTNNKASENQLYLKDSDGNVVFERTSLANSTEYKDTMNLDPGCYTLEVYDSDHDGLGFWYSNIPVSSGGEGETYGFLRLRKVGGSMIEVFDTDFGHYMSYSFSVGFALGTENVQENPVIEVYPNPSEGVYTISMDNFKGDIVNMIVYDNSGRIVFNDALNMDNPEGYANYNLDISSLPSGIYLLQIVSNNTTKTVRLIKH